MFNTIYRITDIVITKKMSHQKRSAMNKRNKRTGIGFCKYNGDIPVVVIDDSNFLQLKTIPVVNTRGLAYAYRNDIRYQKKNKKPPTIDFD